ncbi:MAG: ankyrin repeat domain-containing protein [Burkholderiales bacterium]
MKTSLHHIALRGNLNELQTALQQQGNIHLRDQEGNSLLHQAALSGDVAKAAFLIREGANVNVKNQVGWSPLHDAALSGQPLMVQLLLDHHANPNAMDYKGNTALHIAAYEANPTIVKLLIDKGADVIIKNQQNQKPSDRIHWQKACAPQARSIRKIFAYYEADKDDCTNKPKGSLNGVNYSQNWLDFLQNQRQNSNINPII